MKTKEITLPIDPNKTYVAEFRYGLCAVPITVTGYEHVAGGFEKGWVLIAEVVEDEQPKERDWSGVVKKLMHYAHRHCNSFRYHDSNGLYDLAEFKEDALAILQEFDRPSQPATQSQPSIQKKNDENVTIGHNPTDKESPTVETPLEFIIGGMYDVCDNNGYTSFGKLIDFSTTNGQYVIEHFDGTFCIYLRPGIIGRHSLAEHIYTTQEIKEELNTWQDEPISPVAFCKRGKIIRQLLK